MAITYQYALTNAKGLCRVLYFEGLDMSMVITPVLAGNPLLTAQAFYYLEQLDSVAIVRFEKEEIGKLKQFKNSDELGRYLEYLTDNYLFYYSKVNPLSKITSQMTEYKYWEDEGSYLGYDGNFTKSLALDPLNDTSIIKLSNDDIPNKDHIYDWNVVSYYTDEYRESYISSMKSALGKTVAVEFDDNEEYGTGKYTLPLVETSQGLLSYHQASMLDTISSDRLSLDSDRICVSRGFGGNSDFYLPVETFHVTNLHDSELLAYFFSGIKEHLPISKFRRFYNVLEYFFEAAPAALGETARNEREQISCVLRWVITKDDLVDFISNSVWDGYLGEIQGGMVSTNGLNVEPFSIDSENIVNDVAVWLYDIRCACVHSKATYKGRIQPRFVPYSDSEKIVSLSIPILQTIAVLCIEKDGCD